MKAFWRILTHWLTTTALAFVILSLVIWLVGDLVAFGAWKPFGTWVPKLVVTLVLLAIWLALLGLWLWRRARRNRDLAEEIVEDRRDPTAEALSAEQQAVEGKFADAMRKLSKLRFKSRFGGSRYLYELPWYIFIGPPGAGKTTALEKCGLDFPLRKKGDSLSISDTRNIEWIFTNEAVFIDTAGRYTTQDSAETIDAGAWSKLLDLIVRKRPGEPINGVIVAISIGDLAMADSARIDAHAQAVRDRLIEICEKMRARVPVYLMFTKADLLVGFNEFFQSLSKADREQVWGMTYPLTKGQGARARTAGDLDRFDADFDLLVERLGEMQFVRLQEENEIEDRAKVFGFASQFSSLKPVISRFLRTAFEPDKWSDVILLRGFYFSSATQVGQPVDRLLSTMTREFGLERRVVDALTGVREKSFFLAGLLREVIFPEAGLVSASRKGRRAALAGRVATIAGCLLVPVLFGLGWWTVEQHMEAEASQFTAAVTEYEKQLHGEVLTPVADNDFEKINDPLNILRAEVERLSGEDADAPLYGMGIAQMDDLRTQAELAYHEGLETLLRPRLLFRLETLLAEKRHLPEELYEVLKAYRLLAGNGPMTEINQEFLARFVRDDWETLYDPTGYRPLLASLEPHMAELLELSVPAGVKPDYDAISEAVTVAGHLTLGTRAYNVLKRSPAAEAMAPWSLTGSGRFDAEKVFVRKSRSSLDNAIPGLYTIDGFFLVFLPNADQLVEAALQEKWVLARPNPGAGEVQTAATDAEAADARTEIRQLYARDYIAHWQAFLEDIRIAHFEGASDAADKLRILASPQSPLVRLIEEVVRNTQLAQSPPSDDPMWQQQVKSIAFNRFAQKFQQISRVAAAGTQDLAGQQIAEGNDIQRAFRNFHDFLGTEASGGGIRQVIDQLRDLYVVVDDIARQRGSRLIVLSEQTPAIALERNVTDAPPEIRDMVIGMLEQADAATVDGAKDRLNEIWRTRILRACSQLIQGRYPFGDGREVALGDLTRVLGPNGLIDDFYRENLASMVDDTVSPWRWQGSYGASLGIPNDRLAFFEQAWLLREAFFPNNAPAPGFGLDVAMLGIHADAVAAEFSLGGVPANFQSGQGPASAPARLEWPGPHQAAGAQLRIQLAGAGAAAQPASTDQQIGQQGGQPSPAANVAQVQQTGQWGLFQLIGGSGFRSYGEGEELRTKITADGASVFFQLRFDSAINPFKLRPLLAGFRCPTGF